MAVITVGIASRITIQIPRVRGFISVSDTLLFLTILIFGGEAAILLAAAEGLCSSLRVSKKFSTIRFNAGVLAFSTFLTVRALDLCFGQVADLQNSPSTNLVVAVCLMALVQYVANSGIVALYAAFRDGQSIWNTWKSNFLWTSITYFAGAVAAGVIAKMIDAFGFYAFIATTPIIAIVYVTYLTYLKNVETSAAQADQAERHVIELNHYIAEQERISKALQESEEHFRSAFDYAAIGMALVEPSGRWLRVNRAICEIVGYTESELLATDFQAITNPDDLAHDLAQLGELLDGQALTCQMEKQYVHKFGHGVWVSLSASLVRDTQGVPLHFIFQIQDIAERKRAEAALRSLSLVDDLTGLYNRRGFLAFAEHHHNLASRTKKGFSVIFTDLDGMKTINDTFGHQEGDAAIIKTAEILRSTFRESDVIARLGGDEFTVLATGASDDSSALIINRLQEKVREYNAQKNHPYNLSVSVGVARFDADNVLSIEELMSKADEAMYEYKRKKKRRAGLELVYQEDLSQAVA